MMFFLRLDPVTDFSFLPTGCWRERDFKLWSWEDVLFLPILRLVLLFDCLLLSLEKTNLHCFLEFQPARIQIWLQNDAGCWRCGADVVPRAFQASNRYTCLMYGADHKSILDDEAVKILTM
jgi:hypothetical protein